MCALSLASYFMCGASQQSAYTPATHMWHVPAWWQNGMDLHVLAHIKSWACPCASARVLSWAWSVCVGLYWEVLVYLRVLTWPSVSKVRSVFSCVFMYQKAERESACVCTHQKAWHWCICIHLHIWKAECAPAWDGQYPKLGVYVHTVGLLFKNPGSYGKL